MTPLVIYMKVPGYGEGGAHEIAGPRTYYKAFGESWAPAYYGTGKMLPDASRKGMTWADYWIKVAQGYKPAY